jgi:signal transduction histidine kinase
MKYLEQFKLKKISGQIAALVIASIVAVHALITTIFLLQGPPAHQQPSHLHGQLATLVRLVDATPSADKPALIETISQTFPDLAFRATDAAHGPTAATQMGPLSHLQHELGTNYRLWFAPGGHDQIGIAARDGSVYLARLPSGPPPHPFLGSPITMTLLFVVACLILLGIWAARALSEPLSSLAAAARSFSLDTDHTPLPIRGPDEIRSVAQSFNHMRQRIAGLINDRTKMLAAISHDLRTPITRLRLRAELIENEEHRHQTLHDLNQMNSMLNTVLSFLKDGTNSEEPTLADVSTILQSIADQFLDAGHSVTFDGPLHFIATVRPMDFRRAVTNLVENAVRFAGSAVIRLTAEKDGLGVDVADSGPGIEDAQIDALMEPFVRGDSARSMNEVSGFGLGLSIARSIASAHGGELTLSNLQPNGLIARIRLPMSSIELPA